MKKSSLVYLFAAVSLFVFGFRAAPFTLLHPQTLLLVVLPAVLILAAVFRPLEMKRAFQLAGNREQGSAGELRLAMAFFRTMQKTLLLLGGIGAVGALLRLLYTLPVMPAIVADRVPQRLLFGHEVAGGIRAVLLPLVLVALVVVPCKAALAKKLARSEAE